MPIKELTNLAHRLYDISEEMGNIEDATTAELEEIMEVAGEIVLIFEKDEKLYKKLMKDSNRTIKNDLKTLVVACHKAIPHKESVEHILGNIDWWDFNDTALELSEIVGAIG